MANEAKFWILANTAAKELGWFAETVFSQWEWETGHFTSTNLLQDNNIAGQTWTSGCGFSQGLARPASEGGHYIKYPDVVTGYVSFVKNNIGRYGNVAKQKTVEGQLKQIAADHWAADPQYANHLLEMNQYNVQRGYYKLPRTAPAPKLPQKPAPKQEQKTAPVKAAAPLPVYHVVTRGETLSGIAATYKTTVANLVKLNGIKEPNVIHIGQRLRVK